MHQEIKYISSVCDTDVCLAGDEVCDVPDQRECYLRGACEDAVAVESPIALDFPEQCYEVSTTFIFKKHQCLLTHQAAAE